MTETELKKEWKKTITPFVVFVILLIISVLFNRLGSKKPTPQTVSLFASVYSLTFTIFYGIKILLFRKKLKLLNNN
jgi:predicted neutral ceramidase superfamily lipid hydrolase